jgi:hypothetical protein
MELEFKFGKMGGCMKENLEIILCVGMELFILWKNLIKIKKLKNKGKVILENTLMTKNMDMEYSSG